jgi:CRP/FNR family transcriptional regulator, cyclic AMP receptor protein
MSRIDRFLERDELVDALLRQTVIQGRRPAAEALADGGKVVSFPAGAEIIRQRATETHCYFLLAGTVGIQINGEWLPYQRGPNDILGEFSAINSRINRTATVTVREEVVALECSAALLRKVADGNEGIWRLIAIEVATKIDQRNQLIPAVNERPNIIMIAADERLATAKALKLALSRDYDVELWSEADLVPPGGIEIDVLHEKARLADFGIVFAHPDDLAKADERGTDEQWETVRFELGYIMSQLTRHRTLVMLPAGEDGAMPRMFKGVQPMTYQLPAERMPLHVVLVEVVDTIKELIRGLDVRSRLNQKER